MIKYLIVRFDVISFGFWINNSIVFVNLWFRFEFQCLVVSNRIIMVSIWHPCLWFLPCLVSTELLWCQLRRLVLTCFLRPGVWFLFFWTSKFSSFCDFSLLLFCYVGKLLIFDLEFFRIIVSLSTRTTNLSNQFKKVILHKMKTTASM